MADVSHPGQRLQSLSHAPAQPSPGLTFPRGKPHLEGHPSQAYCFGKRLARQTHRDRQVDGGGTFSKMVQFFQDTSSWKNT